jgi:hypothetical protein
MSPEIDERVDVVIERVLGCHVQNLMKKDVRLQRSHEEKRRGSRIAHAQNAGFLRAPEVVRDDRQAASRRRIRVARIERQNDRRLRARVHVDSEILGQRPSDERHELLRHVAEDDSGIGVRVNRRQLNDERGNRERLRAHRRTEQRLLRRVMTQDRGCGHFQLSTDVGQRRLLESLRCEDAARGVQEMRGTDRRRPAHL